MHTKTTNDQINLLPRQNIPALEFNKHRGEPMRHTQKDKIFSLRIPESVYENISWIADQKYTDISSVVRNGIRKELADNQELLDPEYIRKHQHHSVAY